MLTVTFEAESGRHNASNVAVNVVIAELAAAQLDDRLRYPLTQT
jgi:hypothetical protein